MSNGLIDSSGSQCNLFGTQIGYTFTSDRFCNINSALYLCTGYVQAPSSYYFTGDFSVVVWIYLNSYQTVSAGSGGANVFNFSNANGVGEVSLTFVDSTSALSGNINNLTGTCLSITTSPIIQLNTWYHVVFVLRDTIGSIYVNGVQKATGTLQAPSNIIRNYNYIGSNNLNGSIDELTIYEEAMTQIQILNEYSSSSANGISNSIPAFNLLLYNCP